MSHFKFIIPLFILCASLAPLAAGQDARGLAHLAPDETLLYAEVQDISQLQALLERSGPGRLWQDAAFAEFFKPLRANFKINFARGGGESPPMEELKRTFTGAASIFLSEMIFGGATENSPGYQERNTGFMLEFEGDSEKIKEWIERYVIGIDRLPGDHVRTTEAYRGVQIYTTVFRQKLFDVPAHLNLPTAVDGDTTLPMPLEVGTAEYHYEYAFVDNLCIVLEGQRAFMKKVLGNYFATRDGAPAPASSLAGTEEFRLAMEPVGAAPQVLGYANLGRLVGKYQGAGDLVQFGPLKLEEFRSGCIAVRLTPVQMLTDVVVVAHPRVSGLASLLVGDLDNRFATRRLVPRDAVSYSSFWFAPQKTFELATTLFFGPQGTQIIESGVEQQTGLRLREDLLEPLQGEIGSYMRLDTDKKMKSAYLVALDRPDGYADKMADWLRFMYGQAAEVIELKSVDYMGYPIYSWSLREGVDASALPQQFSPPSTVFSVAGGCLILGQDEGVTRHLIQAILEGGETIDRNPEFGRAVADLSRGNSWLTWMDLGDALGSSLEELKTNRFARGLLPRIFNIDAVPEKQLIEQYLGSCVSGFYSSMGRAHFHNEIKWPVE